MQLTWPQVQIQPERRLSVPLEQKCKEEIVGVASVATQLSPVYELTHNVQKQSSLCPHVKTQTQLGSSWDLHLPSLSKFLGGLCSVSRETAKRSGAPRAGGRSEAGLRQVWGRSVSWQMPLQWAARCCGAQAIAPLCRHGAVVWYWSFSNI